MAITNLGGRVIKLTAQGDSFPDTVKISYLRWVNATNADDVLDVQDTKGNTIFPSVADGANFLDICPIFDMIKGINVVTMDSGTLYIYVR